MWLFNIIAAKLLDGDQRLARMKALKFGCNILILHGSNTIMIALDNVLGSLNLDRLTHVKVRKNISI